jgi:hypothetical protein
MNVLLCFAVSVGHGCNTPRNLERSNMAITAAYVKGLPEIYRDLLSAFPHFDATRKVGYGLSFQSLYSALEGKYKLGQDHRRQPAAADRASVPQAGQMRLPDDR